LSARRARFVASQHLTDLVPKKAVSLNATGQEPNGKKLKSEGLIGPKRAEKRKPKAGAC
jgi:hypothetical protein